MADTVCQSQRKDPSIRKSNKPLMEKKRRARINNCLGQLKTLTLQALKKDSSQFSKLEKADILELTVKHLRNLQRQQISMTTEASAVTKYRAGFNECANEVMRYVGSSQEINNDVSNQLMNHLANCLQTVNNIQSQETVHQRCLQPISVQIPSNTNVRVQAPATPPSIQHQPSSLPQTPVAQAQIIPSPTSTPSSSPVHQLTGSFHLVPGNMNSGNAVALYLGNQNGHSMPVYSLQMPHDSVTSFVPSSPSGSISPVSSQGSISPVYHSEKRYSDMRFSPYSSCSPSKLKEEKVWRPW